MKKAQTIGIQIVMSFFIVQKQRFHFRKNMFSHPRLAVYGVNRAVNVLSYLSSPHGMYGVLISW